MLHSACWGRSKATAGITPDIHVSVDQISRVKRTHKPARALCQLYHHHKNDLGLDHPGFDEGTAAVVIRLSASGSSSAVPYC